MSDHSKTTDWTRIANGLIKAITTPTDELAVKKGEDDLMVRIKRNSDRLQNCVGHDFERQPNWRASPLYGQKVRCLRCEGEMKTNDAMTYLRGFAHGANLDYDKVIAAIWPSGKGDADA